MTEISTAVLTIQLLCLAGNLVLLLAPYESTEVKIMRRLRVSALRKRLTKRLKAAQPLDETRTVAIARKNIIWHVVMTVAMLVLPLTGAGLIGVPRTFLELFGATAALAWLMGSVVQRQKIALITARLSERPARVEP